MRKLILVGALVTAATPAVAQQMWHPEIGVQGGYVRVKAAGSPSDPIDIFEFPTMGYLIPLLTYAPVFATIPWSDRFALEPTLAFAQLASGANDINTVRLGLRGNYAFSTHLYGGLGGVLNYASGASPKFQVGAQIGAGYRFGLGPRLGGRVEASWISTKGNSAFAAQNAYALLFGMSARLNGPAARTSTAASDRAWQPAIGMTGGYSNAHIVGGGSITGIIYPGFGGSLSTLGGGNNPPFPPTIFAILPIGKKVALEPGLDLHRIQSGGTTAFGANIGARLDLAIHRGWYAAAGAQLLYLKATPGTFADPARGSATISGATLAWGYRFNIAGQIGGRTELNYSLYGKNTDIPSPPMNVTSILFGVTMPLK